MAQMLGRKVHYGVCACELCRSVPRNGKSFKKYRRRQKKRDRRFAAKDLMRDAG